MTGCGNTAGIRVKWRLETGQMRLSISQARVDGYWGRRAPMIKCRRAAKGATLVEAMVTAVVVSIAELGGLSYEYLSAKHTKIAVSQMTATRTARLLLEDWKSTGGSAEYNPSRLGLGFSKVSTQLTGIAVPPELEGMTATGVYSARSDGLPMVITLKHKDVAEDPDADVKLRQLSILVSFGEAVGGELMHTTGWVGTVPPITVTTFVRSDGSTG